ncbi:pyridoxamine 5'-phosphate oxidase family protein [Nonomuraea rubra]
MPAIAVVHADRTDVFTDRALPAAQPVAFHLDGERIVIRTGIGSKLAAATRHAVVAFEADEFDQEERTGWSVTVIGHARAAQIRPRSPSWPRCL